jgi:septum site-determining protein MinD
MSKRIVIFSTKGGVGRTLIASNVAVALAREQKKRVCVVDLDLLGVGDMARMLDLKPKLSLVDLIPLLKKEPDNINKDDFLARNSFGVDFLAGILNPKESSYLESAMIKNVFDFLEKDYDYIFIDTGKGFSEISIAALNQANLILLVVTPDILTIYQTKWALEILQILNFPLSMVKIILNRAESASSIGWQEIKETLPVEIIAWIPSEGKIAGLAINRGIPVVIDSPKTKIALSIKKFANELSYNDDLYIQRQEISQLSIKDMPLEKPGDFWRTLGLAEPEPRIKMLPGGEKNEVLLLKRRIHKRLIDELNLKRMELKEFTDLKKRKELREKAELMVTNILAEEAGSLIASFEARKKLVKEIIDEALGLGPLEDLLNDPDITDIMVNNKDEVYIERRGKIELTDKKFISDEQVKTVIERIVAPLGRHIDESMPMVDARLPDGSRVNAIVSPLSLTGPALTIRKFKKGRFTTDELMDLRTLNSDMAGFLKACVLGRKNMIVSGASGSGKTTVLNVLSEFIPNTERIITIEDAAELQLHQAHWIRLESRPPNIEGKGAIAIRDLFRNTLRMRPDRIIIGECRGNESLDMLQAMNTGHDGSLTTVHANTTQDVLVRLDSMILMAGAELPIRAIREMIASAIDIIVHTARLSDGSRKIVQITEISGMKDELHINFHDIFVFKQTGIDTQGNVLGDFQFTGYLPSFIEELKIKGIPVPPIMLKPQ